MSSPVPALVLIDYQNIHLSAHDRFAPSGVAKHETLVHPLHFASQVVSVRSGRVGTARVAGSDGVPDDAVLQRVEAFRGQPSNKHDPRPYARALAQQSEWTRDPRVGVHYRTLRYWWDRDTGRYEKREKGIDVMLALAVVKAAQSGHWGVVILASHDTDLEPALEMAVADTAASPCSIETAGWDGCKILRPSGLRLWHTALGERPFIGSRDRKLYN